MKRWWKTAREVGPVSFAVKAFRELEVRSGLLPILSPAHYYETDVSHPRQSAFLKRTELYRGQALDREVLSSFYERHPVERELALAFAEMVRLGSIRWFEESVDIEVPPDWHWDPIDNIRWPRDHYSALLREPSGDFRTIWELGRLGFVLDLARAFIIDRDPRWLTLFTRIVRSFVRENPVNEGVHWTNGQEVALRTMNLLQAMRVFGDAISGATYDELCDVLYWHGRYIHQHFEFAEDVLHNNHLIAEAVALNGLGCFFREWPEAFEWSECGLRGLRNAVDQFPDNGGYCQASHSYHRFAIQLLLWAPTFGCDVSEFREAFRRTSEMWRALVDPNRGDLPNFGQNDGAWFGPRGAASLRDYRDVADALQFYLEQETTFGRSEFGAWLFDEKWQEAEPTRAPLVTTWSGAGLAAIQIEGGSSATVRTNVGNVRAGHEDLTHVDLMLAGERITLDSGSAVYLSDETDRGFGAARHHCVLTCTDYPLRTPLGKFSWQAIDYEPMSDVGPEKIEISHTAFSGWAYSRVVTWSGGWNVTDRLEPSILDEPREFVLRWILPYADTTLDRVSDMWRVSLHGFDLSIRTIATTSPDVTLEQTVVAPHYQSREPALLMTVRFVTRDGFVIESVFESTS